MVAIIERLDIGRADTRVGLVTYADQVESVFYLNSHYDSSTLIRTIQNLDRPFSGGYTNTSGMLIY